MDNLRIIIGLGLAFLIVVAVVGYFIRKAAGKRTPTDSGGGRKDRRTR